MDDLDDLDVEFLDDELLGTPGKDPPSAESAPPAPVAKANPLSLLPPLRKPQLAPLPPIGGAKPPAAPRALAPVSGGSSASTPTAAALAARATAEAIKSQAAPARVTGSLTGAGDDSSSSSSSDGEDSDDDERFRGTIVPPTENKIPDPSGSAPALENDDDASSFGDEAFDVQVLDVDVKDEDRKESENKRTSTSVGRSPMDVSSENVDTAIDAIDALDAAAAAASSAAQRGVDRLAETYVDTFDLEMDGEESGVAGSARNVRDASDDASDDDDEFGYAFEGATRSGTTHGAEFKAKPMPQSLVTDVRNMPMDAFEEGDEEGDEESEESDDDEGVSEEPAVVSDDGGERFQGKRDVEDEWDVVTAQRDAELEGTLLEPVVSGDSKAKETSRIPKPKKTRIAPRAPLRYLETRAYFADDEIDEALKTSLEVEELPETSPAGCCGVLLARVFATKRAKLASAALLAERDAVFATAKTPFAEDDATHVNLLNAVYSRFLETEGKVVDVSTLDRFGSHWQRVGFQGSDPATDLRGCGMLGLLQLFCLVETDRENASKIFALSLDFVHEFPMAPLGINVTKACLKALRRGLLTEKANALGSVWDAIDVFYKGAWFEFFSRWRDGKCTMAQSGFVMKEWERFVVSPRGAKRAFELAGRGIPPVLEEETGQESARPEKTGGETSKDDGDRGDDDDLEFTSF